VASSLTASISSLSRHSAVRFVLVGGVSFLIDEGILWLMHGVLNLWLPLATVIGYAASFVVNFALNRSWSFGADGDMKQHLRRYLSLVAGNLVLTVVGVSALTALGMPYLVSKVVIAAVVAAINYVAYRLWVFR
jgi:putative flippase GtrA